MKPCESRGLLDAYVDGELDLAGEFFVQRHVRECEACLIEIENMRALTSAMKDKALRFEAPERLKSNLQTAIHTAIPVARRSSPVWRRAAVLAVAVLVVVLTWAVNMQRTAAAEERVVVTEIISSHVRSMMAEHITDISSSDSHTVKPWFGGRLDYSPPTKDLADQGFRLIGGRLDYLENRPVAALVYQRRQHYINLFVWPTSDTSIRADDHLTRQGFNLVHWADSDMTYWLVSELNSVELDECARLLRH